MQAVDSSVCWCNGRLSRGAQNYLIRARRRRMILWCDIWQLSTSATLTAVIHVSSVKKCQLDIVYFSSAHALIWLTCIFKQISGLWTDAQKLLTNEPWLASKYFVMYSFITWHIDMWWQLTSFDSCQNWKYKLTNFSAKNNGFHIACYHHVTVMVRQCCRHLSTKIRIISV